ncbi:unnamed protein product [marine sediment metagenome]|uniref:Uncharacterized protein n=1 Tax=marine sediment metagenome TaxID=412755 RepID=X1MSS8_9ZZZZ
MGKKCVYDPEWNCPYDLAEDQQVALDECAVCIENKKVVYLRIIADSLDTLADNVGKIGNIECGLKELVKQLKKYVPK